MDAHQLIWWIVNDATGGGQEFLRIANSIIKKVIFVNKIHSMDIYFDIYTFKPDRTSIQTWSKAGEVSVD